MVLKDGSIGVVFRVSPRTAAKYNAAMKVAREAGLYKSTAQDILLDWCLSQSADKLTAILKAGVAKR